MNRRGFFRAVGAVIGAASVAPAIFIPKLEPVKWKKTINPAWLNADHEVAFMSGYYGVWQFVTYKQNKEGVWIQDVESKIPVTTGHKRIEVKMGEITFHDV